MTIEVKTMPMLHLKPTDQAPAQQQVGEACEDLE
jgi:hypothetical protein